MSYYLRVKCLNSTQIHLYKMNLDAQHIAPESKHEFSSLASTNRPVQKLNVDESTIGRWWTPPSAETAGPLSSVLRPPTA